MLTRFTAVLVFLTLVSYVNAQDAEDANNTLSIDIPEVAIMDIESEGGQSISLIVEAPSEAGNMIDLTAAVDSSLWLNYSSVRSQAVESSRAIYAKVIGGSVPSGLKLRVKPQPYTGTGDGDLGLPSNGTNGRVLVATDRKIIRNIKTCYTGDGTGNGHRLIYSLEFRNNKYDKLDFDDSNTVTVLYTITDT
ncbi:MAG: hypothetical protein KC517_11750 [Bacteroidetes bacterium]|jgi:hypothetical protein|nr:hypothetical protein [Bacteroidota bacterium]